MTLFTIVRLKLGVVAGKGVIHDCVAIVVADVHGHIAHESGVLV